MRPGLQKCGSKRRSELLANQSAYPLPHLLVTRMKALETRGYETSPNPQGKHLNISVLGEPIAVWIEDSTDGPLELTNFWKGDLDTNRGLIVSEATLLRAKV